MKPRVQATLINPKATIREAMATIQNATHKAADAPSNIALAVNHQGTLIGIVTDGDIRRALLAGKTIDEPVTAILNRRPITFSKDLSPNEMVAATIRAVQERYVANRRLDVIITVDEKNRPYDIFPFFELWQRLEVKTRIVTVVGLGYVGLTLALVLADLGFKVIGIDNNPKVAATLRRGKSHVHERGLDQLLVKHLNKTFFISDSIAPNDSNIYIIAVGTPVDRHNRVIIKPLEEALTYIKNVLKRGDLVILRSTVPVGTCRQVAIPQLEKQTDLRAGEDFHVAFAPERTVEGDAIRELRILPQVIGGYTKVCAELAANLFKTITDSLVIVDNLESAEMVKLLNNTYRDALFSFANEVALMCDALGIDAHKVIQAANHGYARSHIPTPSPGVGGYCLSKDPHLLVSSVTAVGYKPVWPLKAREINESMIDFVAGGVDRFLRKTGHGKKTKIFIMGLAFKGNPETSDTRYSPSLAIAEKLAKRYRVFGYDPLVPPTAVKKEGIGYQKPAAGFKNADCVLILTNHNEFRDMDLTLLITTMKKPGLLWDAWRLYPELAGKTLNGITYRSM